MSFTLAPCNQCEKINRVSLGRAEAEQPVCGNCRAPLPVQHGVVNLSGTSLQHLIERSLLPLVVDFWAPGCVPCIAFEPEFEKAAQQFSGRAVFGKMNSSEFFLAAQAYGIRAAPTLILFENGDEIERKFGAISSAQLADWLNRNVKPAQAAA